MPASIKFLEWALTPSCRAVVSIFLSGGAVLRCMLLREGAFTISDFVAFELDLNMEQVQVKIITQKKTKNA